MAGSASRSWFEPIVTRSPAPAGRRPCNSLRVAPETTIRAGRRRVRISSAGKLLFPADGITKAELAAYYAQMAPSMAPHVRDRPLNLWRWNRGIDGELVVQQEIPR